MGIRAVREKPLDRYFSDRLIVQQGARVKKRATVRADDHIHVHATIQRQLAQFHGNLAEIGLRDPPWSCFQPALCPGESFVRRRRKETIPDGRDNSSNFRSKCWVGSM